LERTFFYDAAAADVRRLEDAHHAPSLTTWHHYQQ